VNDNRCGVLLPVEVLWEGVDYLPFPWNEVAIFKSSCIPQPPGCDVFGAEGLVDGGLVLQEFCELLVLDGRGEFF
jgi:hypothetical protein